jgi:hypothetical protein
MTTHEMLAVAAIAEEWHAKPVSEGGHNEPLTHECFMIVLAENAITLGYPASYLRIQFRARFSRLVSKGWVRTWRGTCGQEHFGLTEKGAAQLNEWNDKGCGAHQTKGIRAHHRRCTAPELPRPSREAA